MSTIHLGDSRSASVKTPASRDAPMRSGGAPESRDEPLSIDEVIDSALLLCENLPRSCEPVSKQIRDLRKRLSRGRLHLAVLGQFNRGKSSFVNALTGLHVLPVSVLPVTTVPTLICYAREVVCTVRFLKDKPDLVIHESPERISQVLAQYVAEENNPQNELCVQAVEVTCPSPLLENGTVLIDTPGFGSTHLHNTKTTLDLLAECDAALFLLGADPPTQTELEFLKQVHSRVPRIFFILNKADLLSAPDRVKIEKFMRSVLNRVVCAGDDLRIFHTSALQGARAAAAHTPGDPDWEQSGMAAVQAEIQNFLTYNKYFALSEALSGKLSDAFDEITAALTREHVDLAGPVELLQREIGDFASEHAALEKWFSEELARLGKLRIDTIEAARLNFSRIESALEQELIDSTNTVIYHSDGSKSLYASLSATMPQFIRERFRRAWAEAAVTLVHVLSRENARIRSDLNVLSLKVLSQSGYEKIISELPFDTDQPQPGVIPESAITVNLIASFTIAERLGGKKKRIRLLQERIAPELHIVVQNARVCMSGMFEQEIDRIFERRGSALSARVNDLIMSLDSLIQKKKVSLCESKAAASGSLNKLADSIEAFKSLHSRLIRPRK